MKINKQKNNKETKKSLSAIILQDVENIGKTSAGMENASKTRISCHAGKCFPESFANTSLDMK